MTTRPRFPTFAAAVLTMASALGCGSDAAGSEPGANEDDTGSLDVLLSVTPADAACLKLTVEGTRAVSKNFDLTPGSSSTLSLDRLPVGVVRVDGAAYSQQCSAVTPSTAPAYVTDKALAARIDPLEIAKILLKLVRNGRSRVTVDFEAPPWFTEGRAPLDFAVIGDTPYGAAQIDDFPNLLAAVETDARVASLLHVGDIKNGSSRCDDGFFNQIFTGLATAGIPVVYTPGDNEWTDCHRANNGAYDPLERLAKVREVFYPTPGLALGGGTKQVLPQSSVPGFEKFVENVIWFEAGVAFGTVHVVGSNDGTPPWYADDTTGTKVDDPARRNAERAERNGATLAWMKELFGVARDHGAAGVVVAMQADMFDAFSVANNLPLDAFDGIVQKLAELSRAFGKPVLLLEGDSHVFIADKPLENGNRLHGVTISVPNLTRIVVQGSTTTPRTEWLRVHVDAATPGVFTWERNAR